MTTNGAARLPQRPADRPALDLGVAFEEHRLEAGREVEPRHHLRDPGSGDALPAGDVCLPDAPALDLGTAGSCASAC